MTSKTIGVFLSKGITTKKFEIVSKGFTAKKKFEIFSFKFLKFSLGGGGGGQLFCGFRQTDISFFKFWQDAGTTTLKEVIDLLEEFNYFCFFIFDKRLLPLSGDFWKRNYEIRQWSNVLCGYEQNIMFKIAEIYHLAYSSENYEGVWDWLFETE